MRLNLPLIEEELARDKVKPVRGLVWLEESYRDPAAFWHSLKTSQDAFSPLTGKSIPFRQYDFYHDLITRNRRLTTPALRLYDSLSGWQEISYSELDSAASRQAASWTQLQVEPGQVLCIMYPVGVKYVVSLLAAFKTGLTVSFLPPQGSSFLQKRLQALNPDYIITEEIFSTLVPGWQDRLLPEHGQVSTQMSNIQASTMDAANSIFPDRSHTYLAGEVIARCFDPSSRTPHVPKELTADAAYLCPLRDGIIALGLRPGAMVAGLGLHFLESYPGLLLASMLTGGTYLHLGPDDIAANPKLLTAYPARIAGISQKVRDILLRNPVEVGKLWYSWFRNPAESFDLDEWQSFIQALKLEDAYAANLKWDAALGGCSLFSIKRKGQAHPHVLPSAGVPWCLTGLSGTGSGFLGDCGLFSPVSVGRKAPPYILPSAMIGGEKAEKTAEKTEEETAGVSVLARSRKEWLFAGSLLSGSSVRAGRVYPGDEILETIRAPHPGPLPEGEGDKGGTIKGQGPVRAIGPYCSIVQVPVSGTVAADSLFVFLIFTGAGGAGMDEAAICKKVRSTIEREMGQEFLPDRIQFFPLLPRCDAEGNIDHNWCQNQYLNGCFSRKSRQEIYRSLTCLRELVRESAQESARQEAGCYRSPGK
jgi:hypothetical protein